MRIDKLFSTLGLLSRSECKKEIKAGHIRVGDRVVLSPAEQVDPENDDVFFRGEPVRYSEFVYYMLNKPAGYVTANSDPSFPTVFDLIDDTRKDLAAVGRLDKDTTGFLLITNDGQLNHRLLSSKYHVPKTYLVTVSGTVTEEDLQVLRNGVDIGDDAPTLPAQAELIEGSVVSLTIYEGRYHQVKRMFDAIGKPVTALHRSSFGPLALDPDLKEGEMRPLTEDEMAELKGAGGS